jgi:glycosyltransferase involved in cell wall biosynthesis
MSEIDHVPDQPTVAFVSDYLPRCCGIATFTHDISEAVYNVMGGDGDVFVVAMNDQPEGYPYPERVRFEVRQNSQADYRLAADFLNINQVSTVCLQHEYGLFGGPAGANILTLLRRVRRPIVSTLHTVLKEPNEDQRSVTEGLIEVSDRLIVLSETAVEFMTDIYNCPPEKVVMVGHGIPDVPFVDPTYYKDQFGVDGKKVLMTFGLLGPSKGLEVAVEALPDIVAKHPEVVYVIVGATHPHIKRDSGEEYRNGLIRRASELGVSENIKFVNRFVELEELCEFLGAADIYLTPYPNEAQIVSGTLAYALGAGKAVVSTPYWYAAEMLDEGRGRLVPFGDSRAISEQVNDLLDNENERHATRKRAYNFTRKLVWSQVGRDYLDVFEQAKENWVGRRMTSVAVPGAEPDLAEDLPELDLTHLRTMSDDVGILQHAIFSTPDRDHGYCTDDNARALMCSAMYWSQTQDETVVPLMQTYLAFLTHALNEPAGRFRNFMDYGRAWTEEVGSEDSHGRALWGLGVATALSPNESMIALSTRLFKAALPATETFTSPRAWAFTIIGIQGYLKRFGGDSDARRCRAVLAERLANAFTGNASDDWPWCEDIVSYANAKLPHALLMAGKWLNRGDWIDLGKRSLQWLLDVQTNEDGALSIIGSDGWLHRDGRRAHFDQQPIEAHALVEACVEAYHVTREPHWIDQARKAFNWFLGGNDLRTPICEFATGGCHDGLHADRVNANQGAESTLAWMTSLLAMYELQMEQTLAASSADKEQQAAAEPTS